MKEEINNENGRIRISEFPPGIEEVNNPEPFILIEYRAVDAPTAGSVQMPKWVFEAIRTSNG